MLKKLVKYGNSNALVLDKAIMELLNMSEGAVVKLKTDGVSLIITPHQETNTLPAVQPVQETMTSQDALLEAVAKKTLDEFIDLTPVKRSMLERKLLALHKKNMELMGRPFSPDGLQELQTELVASNGDVANQVKIYEKIVQKYKPEQAQVTKAIVTFCFDHGLITQEEIDKRAKLQDAMKQYFAELFAGKEPDFKQYMKHIEEMMNSSEFQHKAQLLVEKYKDNQNSKEYLEAYNALISEFSPEIKKYVKLVTEMTEKYKSVAK